MVPRFTVSGCVPIASLPRLPRVSPLTRSVSARLTPRLTGQTRPRRAQTRFPVVIVDWAVSDSTFTALSKQWGPFDIDLFASHRTHRLPAYYATHFAPGAAGVDAFRFRWGRACWAYPPFNLLLRVLKHAQACRARMCLLAPVWPTRDWWPFLTSDGAVFKGFVHGVRVLGKPRDVIAAGQPVPRRADSWVMYDGAPAGLPA